MSKKVVLCLGTLDTKGKEISYVKELLEKKGLTPFIMDISCSGVLSEADLSAEEVAKAAGKDLEELAILKEHEAAEIMRDGAVKWAKELFNRKKINGVLALGGGMGTFIASSVMKELPFGFPKVIVGTHMVVLAGLKPYIGYKDVIFIPSIADLSGLNLFTKKTLEDAVNITFGLIEKGTLKSPEKPAIFMSMIGSVSRCGSKVRTMLEETGYEVIVFHAVGLGGMTIEGLIEEGLPVKGVIELAIHELGNELFGGEFTAGAKRFEAAGKRGIPQVFAPGNAELLGFTALEKIPSHLRDRPSVIHNPQAVAVRLNQEEMRTLAQALAKKLNQSKGPVRLLIPKKGFSSFDREDREFFDPVADRVFVETLKVSLNKNIKIREIEAHINDEEFAKEVFFEAMELFSEKN